MPFDFDNPDNPTFAEIITKVASDPDFPSHRRATALSGLRLIARAMAHVAGPAAGPPDAAPFSASRVEAIFKRVTAATLGVRDKTLLNARSDARFVLQHYRLVDSQAWAPLTPAWQTLRDLVPDPFQRMTLNRLMRFCAGAGIEPAQVTAAIVEPFINAVSRDPRVKDAQLAVRRALRTWNKMASRHAEIWPQVDLRMPRRHEPWGLPWSAFPSSLELAVDAFLAPPVTGTPLFAGAARPRLRPATVRSQKDVLRCVASALVRTGIRPDELRGLGSLCSPAAVERAVRWKAEQIGAVGPGIMKTATVLLKVARYSDALDQAAIAEVVALHEDVAFHHSAAQRLRPNRDQILLDRFDEPHLVDALLQLPTRTVLPILARGGPVTVRQAYAIQRALILELWLCAPLRISNLVALRKDWFCHVTVGDVAHVALRVPGDQVKNGEALEHFLTTDAARLLDLYLQRCLPLISRAPSPFLLPGPDGRPKHHQTLRVQMANYIEKALKIEGFHPHFIRKLVAKLALDQDPSAIEVVRRLGGWKNDKVLRRAYLQRHHRASQAKYLELLEGRRLTSFQGSGTSRLAR